MFIFTAKLNKKKLLTGIIVILVLVIAAVLALTLTKGKTEARSLDVLVRSNGQRVAYLEELGWQVESEPIDEQIITIPTRFDDVYGKYNELQISQGFDLTKYAGLEATRYTYLVTNYPDTDDKIVADIIVYRGRVIAGDVQSTAMDGFMNGLAYPTA